MKAFLPILLPSFRGVLATVMGGFWSGVFAQDAPGTAAKSETSAVIADARDSAVPYTPPDDPRDLLKVDKAMRSYFEALLTASPGSADRLQQIVDAVHSPSGVNFVYDIEGTFSAAETFRRGRGNCVSYAMLIVAVAREFGFGATFQNIESASRWTRFGTVVASVVHVNVRVETDDGLYLVDLRPELLPSTRLEAMELISDARAFSEFYGTIGFFRLVHGGVDEARRCMVRATELDPSVASNWRNLGNVHARAGDLVSARNCFERALRLDRNDLASACSLLEILRPSGVPDDRRKFAKLERQAQAMRDRNPYWQEHLAHLAEEQNNWAEAEKRYRRAIALNDEELEFYAPWIAALRRLGREADARRAEVQLEKTRSRLARQSIHLAS